MKFGGITAEVVLLEKKKKKSSSLSLCGLLWFFSGPKRMENLGSQTGWCFSKGMLQ